MIRTSTTMRRATSSETDIVAFVSRSARMHFLPFLPDLHTFEDDKRFFRDVVFPECDVWVAEQNQEIVGFCAFKEGWVDHLYLRPSHVGMRIGKTLLDKAKENNRYLRLWVFQQNIRARSFYERNCFEKVYETDGSSNEEKTPDVLYEWSRSSSATR